MLSFVYQYRRNKGPNTEGNPKDLLKIFQSVYISERTLLYELSYKYNLLQFSITYDDGFWIKFLIG